MLTSILIGVLVDKKILDYNQKISQIWPEFAKNGKKEGTVADLLRHEIGIPFLKDTLIATDCSVEKIKENKIGAMLEDETYHFPPGEKGEPHTFCNFCDFFSKLFELFFFLYNLQIVRLPFRETTTSSPGD